MRPLHFKSPNYIGIGFRRCATGWLHASLYEHPDIGHFKKNKDTGGMHFFSNDERYKLGLDWYLQQLGSYAHYKVFGELSDSYTYPEVYEQVAKRIVQHYPQIKLFCSVRNPIDRIFSDYKRSVLRLELDKSITFEEAIESDSRFIERGFYARILKEYSPFLSDNRLLVLFYEELRDNPREFIRQLYMYLGVDSDYMPTTISEKKGQSYIPKSQTLNLVQRYISRFFRGIRFGFVLDGVKKVGLQKAIIDLNTVKSVTMQLSTRKRLYALYEEHIDELEALLNKDLSFWKE